MKKSLEEIVAVFLRRRGWDTWYNKNYWVHDKTVSNIKTQDPTRYGMDLVSAFVHEVEDMPPFKDFGMSELSQAMHSTKDEVLKAYFGEEKE